jgi:hypothetical protein
MKCIDVLEGTAKYILDRLYQLFIHDNLDDSEYVRNVKAVIEAIDAFMQSNPELIADPTLLKDVLYIYSRNLWLFGKQPADAAAKPAESLNEEQEEYQTYYYDYLYNRGLYPR